MKPDEEERAALLDAAQAISDDVARAVLKLGDPADFLALIALRADRVEYRILPRSEAQIIYRGDPVISRLLATATPRSMIAVVVLDMTKSPAPTATGYVLIRATKGGEA